MKIKFHKIDNCHFWCESTTMTLVSYDQRLMEHGWECTCEGFAFRHSCKHVVALLDQLSLRPAIIPAREVVKRSGATLESIFDYSRPPTHSVTRRERVKERW